MASFEDKEADFCATMLAKVVSSLIPKNINLRLVTIFRPSMCLRIWSISALALTINPSIVSSMCLMALLEPVGVTRIFVTPAFVVCAARVVLCCCVVL